ncbi:MAG: hypothetical protein GTO22_05950, partial [Gemmatimonadales bacterium]|nr:hypothetical protein [Gemmatimonadales bacterium]
MVTLPLVGWTLFAFGSYWERPLASSADLLLFSSPVLLALLGTWLWHARSRWWPWLRAVLDEHTESMDAIPVSRLGLWIALAAGLGLYAELMVIRLHAS